MGRVFLGLMAFLWPLAALYASEYMQHEEREDSFFAFYTMTFGVMILYCCAGNMFTLYVLFECITLITLPLVWHKKDAASIRAARAYIRYSIGCAAFAFAISVRSVGLLSGSPPFAFTTMVISLPSFEKILPFFASAAPFARLIVAQWL